MGLFIDANGNRKNVLPIKAFSLSILFLILFVLAYLFSVDIVAELVGSQTGSFFQVWLPPVLISLAASAICCAMFLLIEDKLLIPVAFSFFAVYYFICMSVLFVFGKPALIGIGVQFLSMYILIPAIVGNLISWGIYALIRRHEAARIRKKRSNA